VLVAWGNHLKFPNPTEEPLNGTALLVDLRIEPEWPPSLRMSSRSSVDRDIALNSSSLAVLANLPGIVGCICRDNQGAILNIGNLKCFEGWFVKPEIMDIYR